MMTFIKKNIKNVFSIFMIIVLCAMPASNNWHKNYYETHSTQKYSNNVINSNLIANFNVNFSNEISKGNFKYSSKVITYGDDMNANKNEMLRGSIKYYDNNYISYSTAFEELEKGKIIYQNNIYTIEPAILSRPYNYKEKCKEGKHSKLTHTCGSNHIHDRRCTKIIYEPCNGCVTKVGNFKNVLEFNNFEFDLFYKTNNIDNEIIDFAKLIKVDYENSYKFYNRNILSFKFNKKYLNGKMLYSFNQYLANEFVNIYKSKINDELLDVIYEKIKKGYITDYSHYLPIYLGITTKQYSIKNNLQYWVQAYEYKDTNQIKKEINNLEKIDLINYLDINKDLLINDYVWSQLYAIFANNDILKNIKFKISYNTKLNNSNPAKAISLHDLINNKNNYIVYYFSNLNLEHNFEDQAIYVTDVSVTSNHDRVFIKNNNIGLIVNSYENGIDYKDIPRLQNAETWFKYNVPLNIENILKLNNFDIELSKDYLFKNNLIDIASNNKKNKKLIELLTNLKNSPYITLNDSDWLNNLNEQDANLTSIFFNDYIKNIELKYYDSLGIIRVIITLSNGKLISYDVNGFIKKTFQMSSLNDYLEIQDNLNDMTITNEYIINNLIGYLDDFKKNKFFAVNTTKEDFMDNILEEIQIINNKNNYEIKIKYKNHLSISQTKTFSLVNKINLNDHDNNNNKNVNDIKNNGNQNYYYFLTLIPIILLISILFIVIKKYKRTKSGKTIESKKV